MAKTNVRFPKAPMVLAIMLISILRVGQDLASLKTRSCSWDFVDVVVVNVVVVVVVVFVVVVVVVVFVVVVVVIVVAIDVVVP